MKKLLSIAVASFAVAAVAEPFSPAIGVTQITTPLKNTVIPVQFSSLTSGNVTASSLVCTNGLPSGTCLYIFDGTTQSYSAWVLGNTGWIGATRAGEDGISAVLPAEGQSLAVGSALWISIPGASSENQKTFSLYGKVASVTNTTIVAGTKAEPKYNLVCNPTGADVSYDTLTNKLSSIAKNGDTISPLVGTFQGNFVYNEKTKLWTYVGIYEGNTVVSTDITSPFYANAGFWYVSKGGAGSISW